MKSAKTVNAIIDSLFSYLEERIPQLKPLSINSPAIQTRGSVSASIVVSSLFTGSLDGKLSIALDWDTASKLAQIVNPPKAGQPNTEIPESIEQLFEKAWPMMASNLKTNGIETQILSLPTSLDTNVLLGKDGPIASLEIPINCRYGPLHMYLALNETRS